MTPILNTILGFVNPVRLTGPILEKELRVMARRKRNYLIRFLYLLLMMMVIGLSWSHVVPFSQGALAYRIAQMSRMAVELTLVIAYLQFFTAQVLAIVFLAGAISDEIYHKTLGTLMTTPITGMQIVIGKLFSRLLSLILLLSLSLPVLGLISLMGGVPWDYVLSSFCITLTSAIFAGSVSLFISIFQKRAYNVIVQTILALIIWYGGVPVVIGWLTNWIVFTNSELNQLFLKILSYFNPFVGFALNQASVTPIGFGVVLFWPWHCLIVLGESILILLVSAKIVRRVALAQITGQIDQSVFAGLIKIKKYQSQDNPAKVKLRTVKGQPVLWKETREPWLQGRRKISTIITSVIAIGLLLFSYAIGFKERYLDEDYAQIVYGMILLVVGMVDTAMLSATMITAEREARSWSILLATPLTSNQILFGKAAGVLRKSLPAWALLIAHLLIFTALGYLHPAITLHLAMIVAGIGMFLLGSGLFFSSICRRTTTAVMWNIALGVGLWMFVPLFASLTREGDIVNLVFSFHPFVQAGIALAGGGGQNNAADTLWTLSYSWPDSNWSGFGETTLIIGISSLVYGFIGLFFYKLAKENMRGQVF